jgi:hypothetical protein
MLCYYRDIIVHDVNSGITYNGWSSLFLNSNLCMSYVEMKEIICCGLEWNYNDIDVEITRKYYIDEH